MQEDLAFWYRLATCFALGAAARLITTMMQAAVPVARVVIAGSFYSGISGVVIALCLIYFKVESNALLYAMSGAGGLVNLEMMQAFWGQMFPSMINYFSQKFAGRDLIRQDKEPPQ